MGTEQTVPDQPVEHVQFCEDVHVPLPEQTLPMLVELIPKHMGTLHAIPVQSLLLKHVQLFGVEHVPLLEQTDEDVELTP